MAYADIALASERVAPHLTDNRGCRHPAAAGLARAARADARRHDPDERRALLLGLGALARELAAFHPEHEPVR
jgi:hypothetical protein